MTKAKEITQRQKVTKVMEKVRKDTLQLVAEQRARIDNFVAENGSNSVELRKKLLSDVSADIASGVYKILNEALDEFGLKIPDAYQTKNWDYVIKNKELVAQELAEKGADEAQVKEVIDLAEKCMSAMTNLWKNAEEAAEILVERDARVSQKAQNLLYKGIALSVLATVSIAGTMAGFVALPMAALGGMLPAALVLGSLVLVSLIASGSVAGSAITFSELQTIRNAKEHNIDGNARAQTINFIEKQIAYYENLDEKKVEEIRAKVVGLAGALEYVPQGFEAALKQSQQQR